MNVAATGASIFWMPSPTTSAPAVCGEFGKFGQRFAHVRAVAGFEFHADEKNFFRPRLSGFDECFQLVAAQL